MSAAGKPPSRGKAATGLRLPLIAGAALLVALVWFGATRLFGASGNPPTITIETQSGRHVFKVEWAITPEQRSRGLMFREKMDADQGMIFDFGSDQPLAFWMKNTPLSLDMIFIHEDGSVYRVEQRTEPYSERNIPSGAPVRYVLEVLAGTARKIELRPGDKVRLR